MSKILVANDNEDTLYLVGEILRNNSFEVIECRDGVEALELVNIHKPDLILLDIKMPRMDGFETCKKLKSDKKTQSIPIIIQSAAYLDSSNKVKGLELGANDYVTFPINSKELLARVNTQLRIKRLEMELRETENLKTINQTTRALHHEINNPLAIILGWTHVLLKKDHLNNETIDSLNKIETSAIRIKEVMRKLSNITKYVKTTSYEGGPDMIDIKQSAEA